ncbi:hypothetical protein [Bacillus alkalicellulosilyticus]|uniref:hypothetical protein n=1 Tax=Alkalihalobacterium alkalicellulosilyticum TaxID=1912214 RepID=UPI00099787CC|nr:hypothetical protein [Bacillus alkalicellulosilyticus]
MSASHYYDLCSKNIGKAVEIRDIHGQVHRGIIDKCDYDQVYLRPLDGAAPPSSGPGGPGMFFWGFGPGLAAGALLGIGLGSIVALSFLPYPFFW